MTVQDVITYMKTNFDYPFIPNGFPAKGADNSATVKLSGGEPHKYIIGLKPISFQVLVRAKHPATAEDKANEIYKDLHGKEHFFMGDLKVDFCMADQSVPVFIGKDKNELTNYSLNFSCKVRE